MKSDDLYGDIFRGELIFRPAFLESRSLVEAAREVVRACFGESPELLSADLFRERLNEAREEVASPRFSRLAACCLAALGLTAKDLNLDTVRLRAVTPGLEDIESAAPVFYGHRDTWYGNPACQVNAWLPLQRVDRRNSFRFYLDHFEAPIANDSEGFVAQVFERERGFGRLDANRSSVYPRALVPPGGQTYEVEMERADVLLFSAAHLHQTLVNRSSKVRFSLDFRFFRERHLEAEVGAPDRDNRSQGLCLGSFRRIH